MLQDEEPYTIKKENRNYIVDGPSVERLIKKINMDDNESMYYFQKILDELGVSQKLKELGVKEGDTVIIAGWELEWYD